MKIQISLFTSLLSMLLLLSGCHSAQKSSNVEDLLQEAYNPSYAKGFEIHSLKEMKSSIIRTRDPWQGAKGVVIDYMVQRDDEDIPEDFEGVVIPTNPKRIVCMSTTYIPMLEALGKLDRIIAVSGIGYVNNEYIRSRRDQIADVGYEPSYEALVALKPDLVLMYGLDTPMTTLTDRLKEFNIPCMLIGEYLEEDPLGKAEWLAAIGELFGERTKCIEQLESLFVNYNHMKEKVADVTDRPLVMFNTPWNDAWVLPLKSSYVLKLVEDAGAKAVYTPTDDKTLQSIGLETALDYLSKADYWINLGTTVTLKDLEPALLQHSSQIKPLKDNHIYNSNARITDEGGSDYYETGVLRPDIVLGDLITIFHPEVYQQPLYFYRHIPTK